ncbi:DUF7373 family lipoprotein [Nocardia inohanensis]|uniref:DUF7373 family lipoprotein n=1 Tax=Nocardia inohanensis TaxID=209246 RepID=UPI0012F8EFDA|nr:hypothetical protein [Nocardia inohanensis]
MINRTIEIRTVAVILALAFVSACATTGHPVPRHPDPATFDTGIHAIRPLERPDAGNEQYGRVEESVRMAEAVIDPGEADPTLTQTIGTDGLALMPTPARAATLLATQVRVVLEREGMIAGVAVGGADREVYRPKAGEFHGLTLLLLRFPDADAAARAARDIDAVDKAVNAENVSVQIPGYTAAVAHWRPTVASLAATVAHESYVLHALASHTATDLSALTTLARNGFDKQIARLRDFTPTPVAEIASLPLDRDSMLSHMVPAAPGRWPYPAVFSLTRQVVAGWEASLYPAGVVLGPRAVRLWAMHGTPEASAPELHAVNGLDALFRYRTAAAARTAFEHAEQKDSEGHHVVVAPQGVPAEDMRCGAEDQVGKGGFTQFFCRVRYGRYIAIFFARTEQQMRQRAAAQYALLIGWVD